MGSTRRSGRRSGRGDLRLIRFLESEVEEIARSDGEAAAAPLRVRLHDLAGDVLDADEPGAHLFLTRLEDEGGYLRLSRLPQPNGFTRATIGVDFEPTVRYDFVEELSVRRRLEADNHRMEVSVFPTIGTFDSRLARFYAFCLYAQFQSEVLLRYCFEHPVVDPPKHWVDRRPTHGERLKVFGLRYFLIAGTSQRDWERKMKWRNALFSPLLRLGIIRNRLVHRSALPPVEGDEYDELQLRRHPPGEAELARFIRPQPYEEIRAALRNAAAIVRRETT